MESGAATSIPQHCWPGSGLLPALMASICSSASSGFSASSFETTSARWS